MYTPNSGQGSPRAQPEFLAGICAGLARDFDLSPTTVRLVVLAGAVLPAGLVYLALAFLAGPRRGGMRGISGRCPSGARAVSGEFALASGRLSRLDQRLSSIEAFVSSTDFELHKGFRQMRR